MNAILKRELRAKMRGDKAFLLPVGYVFLLTAILLGCYAYWTRYGPADVSIHVDRPGLGWPLGRNIFTGFCIGQIALIVFIAPALTVAAFSVERENQTLKLLLTTPVRPKDLLTGKLLSCMAHITLLILSSLPLIGVCFVLGGISPLAILGSYVLMFVVGYSFAMIGLFASIKASSTTGAIVITYSIVVFLTIVTYFDVLVSSPLLNLLKTLLYIGLIGYFTIQILRALFRDFSVSANVAGPFLLLIVSFGLFVALLAEMAHGDLSLHYLNPIAAMTSITPSRYRLPEVSESAYLGAIVIYSFAFPCLFFQAARNLERYFLKRPAYTVADLRLMSESRDGEGGKAATLGNEVAVRADGDSHESSP